MKTILVALLLAFGLSLSSLLPAAAHQAPCQDLGPGHSTYARHHVVPLAKAGELGHGGHKPGEHRGYHGLCQGGE